MKTFIPIFLTIITLSVATNVYSQSSEISFTQEDRGRLVRLEVKVEAGNESLHSRFDDIKIFMLWGFGILFGGIGLLIGFIIRERKSTILSGLITRLRSNTRYP